jgi:hypothetical protein
MIHYQSEIDMRGIGLDIPAVIATNFRKSPDNKGKVKMSLLQAMEAHRAARG